MANVASSKNGLSMGGPHGSRTTYEIHGPSMEENQPVGRTTSAASNARPPGTWRSSALKKDSATSSAPYPSKHVNGNGASRSDEDIPENMYRPDKEDPEGWIHRDKLAKIESEELQAAGINLANARTRSQSGRPKQERQNSDNHSRREEKRQRLQSPVEIEDEIDRARWDLRLPDEIEDITSAQQMYSNPLLRKSGSKIPVLTSSPLPIPAERYERDTPIARKRTASGSMSLESDLNLPKLRGSTNVTSDDGESSSAIASSKPGSPQKLRSKSATMSPPNSTPKMSASATTTTARKTSAPLRQTPSPSQRPGTRSGEQDRPRTAVNKPEGDPPWLATMYKPDPRLPPDQQLIPTLAKKQMQAQWAHDGAIPKTYDREFTPIAVHDNEVLSNDPSAHPRTPSPVKQVQNEYNAIEQNSFPLQPISNATTQNGRPGTSGSITGGYSTMPKVLSTPLREASPQTATGPSLQTGGRPTNIPPPSRMQAQNLAVDEDEKAKKGCGCCIVM